jgi:hypothetical protein
MLGAESVLRSASAPVILSNNIGDCSSRAPGTPLQKFRSESTAQTMPGFGCNGPIATILRVGPNHYHYRICAAAAIRPCPLHRAALRRVAAREIGFVL